MMLFWVLVTAMTLMVGGLMVVALLRRPTDVAGSSEKDIAVYRDQLKDIEREVERGVLAEEDAERVRVEISRRIIAADRAKEAETGAENQPSQKASLIAAGLIVAVLGGASLYLYAQIGAPGYPDLPIAERLDTIAKAKANRPRQAEAEAEVGDSTSRVAEADQAYLELVQRLRDALKTRPDSLEGFVRLAHAEANLGNFAAANRAQGTVLRLKGDAATFEDYRDYAELLILAAGGYVSPEAEGALSRALTLNRKDGATRYYSGLLFFQTGRPDRAFRLWRDLLDDSDPQDPWVPPVRAQIEEAARLAGEQYILPPVGGALPGPDASAIANAQDMSPEERKAMIDGMVSRLMQRLAAEGGAPPEWARLIRALGVQGDLEKASAIYSEARTKFAANPQGMAQIEAAAVEAGLKGNAGAAAPALPGPDASAVEAAKDMTETDRSEMINSMVKQLSDRLDAQGGSPAEWARLIKVLNVQGRDEDARAAYAKAQKAYGSDAGAMQAIDAAAKAAGIDG